jgi:hypothetical protein
MKRDNRKTLSDMRPEYDFAMMRGRIRGKYVKKYRAGTNLVLIDPELAAAFPSDASVNQALRAVLSITKMVQPIPHKRRG